MVADLGNTIDFLHRVRALKVRGAKGYVGTSNIVWNSLSYSLHFCKNLLALWNASGGLRPVAATCLPNSLSVSVFARSFLLALTIEYCRLFEQEHWQCLEEVDFSFNDLKGIDESVRLLGSVQKLNISHNNVTEIGGYLQHLTCLTELDLSSNGITSVHNRKISLSRMYSLEYLDLRNNAIETVEAVYPLGSLPCLEAPLLERQPCSKAFGERSWEVKLDGKAPDDRERDTVRLRLALRRAREEKEEKERKRREKIEEKIRYISGDVCRFTDELESS
ncbi:leucine Rich repeat-containing domain protein [Ostertagia ostertagi]